jgi:hypothetical protein
MDTPSWFFDWMGRAWPRVSGILTRAKWMNVVSPLITLGVAAAVGVFIRKLWRTEQLFLFYVNDVGHLVLLLLALFLFLPYLEVGKGGLRREINDPATIAVKQFQSWLYCLTLFWLMFYLARFFADSGAVGIWTSGSNSIAQLAQHAGTFSSYLNILSALSLLGLYVVLSRRTVGESPGEMGSFFWLSAVLVVGVWGIQVWADNTGKEAQQIAGIVNGLAVGSSLALIVGRLDSRYLGLPSFTIGVLYVYALIQPLFPYIFEQGATGIRLSAQYALVTAALVMKAILIVTCAKLIDTGRLHFYVSNMRWLEAHAVTMLAQHDLAKSQDGISRPAAPLFSFVHPIYRSAVLRPTKVDFEVKIAMLNAWLGVGWDVRELRAKEVQISMTDVPVNIIRCKNPGTMRIQDNSRHTLFDLFVDLGGESSELVQKLRADPIIAQAIAQGEPRVTVSLVVKDLMAQLALLEERVPQYVWARIEQIDGAQGLSFECSIDLGHLTGAKRQTDDFDPHLPRLSRGRGIGG